MEFRSGTPVEISGDFYCGKHAYRSSMNTLWSWLILITAILLDVALIQAILKL